MKIKNVKVLSFVLAFLAMFMMLPLGMITAYATDEAEEIDEIISDGTVTDEQIDGLLTDIVSDTETEEETEEETEVLYFEYEIENSAIVTPSITEIEGRADLPPLQSQILPDGVYAIENVYNDNYYISVEGAQVEAGFRVQQQNFGSNTPLTDFSRAALFKIARVGNTNQYIIRAMTSNRLSFGFDTDYTENKVTTGYINTDDANVTDGQTFTITLVGGNYVIKPYGSTQVIAAPNSTASGDAGGVSSQLILTGELAAGNRGKWKFTAYTGNEKYGFYRTQTAGMGNGLVKGKTGTMWLKSWSTVINANTPYLTVGVGYLDRAKSTWSSSNFNAQIKAKMCGDFEIQCEVRLGSLQTTPYKSSYTYTVIPDIVDELSFIQNDATGKYLEVENSSTSNGAIIQQNIPSTHPRMQWIFELGGNGYFKIKCVNSGKYIGVDSSNTTKVRQYTSVTDYSLWKLTETSEGAYKMSCKASALSGKVLSVPSTTSGNGVDITMLDYQYYSNFIDVWIVKGHIGSLNITLYVDEGYTARYPSYVSKLSQSTQVIKEKLLSDFFIEVDYSSVSSITTLADECSNTSVGNYNSKCPHGDNNSLNNNSDGLCANSSFSSTGNADKTLHHKNLYNTVYRIPFPDLSETTSVLFSGHNYCKMDENVHDGSGQYGVSWINYGFCIITNFDSTLSERKTLLHEILHWYGAPDHYDIGDVPSSYEMGSNFNSECIFGEDKEDANVMSNLKICDGCKNAIESNLDKFDH